MKLSVTATFVANYTHFITIGKHTNRGERVDYGFEGVGNYFGSITLNTVRGDTIRLLYSKVYPVTNKYEDTFSTTEGNNAYPSSVRITRLDTNKTIILNKKESTYPFYTTGEISGSSNVLFNETDNGKNIPIKYSIKY